MFNIWKGLTAAIAVSAIGLMGLTDTAMADYPDDKPIKVIIGFSPGGGVDLFSRVMSKYSKKYIGQELKYVYKRGGAGTIAVHEMLKQRADGYTLTPTVNPHMLIQASLGIRGFRPKDILWLANMAVIPTGFYVKADSDIKSLDDLVKKVKANPGKIKAAAVGGATGSGTLFLRQYLKAANLGEDAIKPLTYGGGSDMFKSLVGGETDIMIANTNWLTRQPDSVRLLAIAAQTRFPLTPDVPTFKELGVDVRDDASMRTIMLHKDTPADIASKIEAGLAEMAKDPGYIADLKEIGVISDFWDRAKINAFVDSYLKANEAYLKSLN